jgi:hypothetical protein
MNSKDTIFWSVVAIILVGTTAYTYWHFVIARDFILVNYTDCDPTIERCFVWECDPESLDPEEQCTGDPEEDIWYYKIQRRIAANVPECDIEDDDCEPFSCMTEEEGCEETVCTEEAAEEEGAYCSDPDEYIMDHPDDVEEDMIEKIDNVETDVDMEESETGSDQKDVSDDVSAPMTNDDTADDDSKAQIRF